jgi:microcystin-dependent protein
MSEHVLPVLPKRSLDFGTLAVGASQDIIVGDRVELLHWRELSLKVRVHSHTLSGSNTIAISVFPQSHTPEDPSVQWLSQGTSTFVTLSASTPSPALLTLAVPTASGVQPIAAMARVIATGSRAGAGTMQVSLTVEFSAKAA